MMKIGDTVVIVEPNNAPQLPVGTKGTIIQLVDFITNPLDILVNFGNDSIQWVESLDVQKEKQ